MVGPTVFGSRHCRNVGVGMSFGPSVGGTFGPFVGPTLGAQKSVGPTNGPKVAPTKGQTVAPTPTILNYRSQKLLGPTLLANKREKGLLIL